MAEGDRSGRLQSCGKIHLDRHMINKHLRVSILSLFRRQNLLNHNNTTPDDDKRHYPERTVYGRMTA